MASSVPPVPSGPQTNLGLAPNVAGLLCYVPCCIGLIFSIVAAIVEKQSRFVRFHAFQSLLLHAIFIVIAFGFSFLSIGLAFMHIGILSLLLLPIRVLIGLGLLAVLIICMIKANGNEEFELPVLGEMARNWAKA
jgi:uncharacterized membrane protein